MFNVTVINVKKSIKHMIILIIMLLLMLSVTKFDTKINKSEISKINISEKLIQCLNMEIPAIEYSYYNSNNTLKEDKEENEESIIGKILDIELSKVQNKEKEIEEVQKELPQTQDTREEQEEVSTNVSTENVTQNPIKESYNLEIGGTKIKNETSFEIGENILNNALDINMDNIMIFHTHTCESYTPSEQYQYEQTGNFRTTDLEFSVVRVGDELTNYLTGYGFNVKHDKTFHDYPAYTGSYTRSKETVSNLLKETPSDIIIDLHRDAIGSKSNYDPSVKIGEDVVAQLMFVIGTNGGGLYHPNWQSNLEFAIKVQQKANEIYPGLFKPIIIRNSRYNQHLGKAACIIEVGATGNTLEQCIKSMKYLSKVFSELK